MCVRTIKKYYFLGTKVTWGLVEGRIGPAISVGIG